MEVLNVYVRRFVSSPRGQSARARARCGMLAVQHVRGEALALSYRQHLHALCHLLPRLVENRERLAELEQRVRDLEAFFGTLPPDGDLLAGPWREVDDARLAILRALVAIDGEDRLGIPQPLRRHYAMACSELERIGLVVQGEYEKRRVARDAIAGGVR